MTRKPIEDWTYPFFCRIIWRDSERGADDWTELADAMAPGTDTETVGINFGPTADGTRVVIVSHQDVARKVVREVARIPLQAIVSVEVLKTVSEISGFIADPLPVKPAPIEPPE